MRGLGARLVLMVQSLRPCETLATVLAAHLGDFHSIPVLYSYLTVVLVPDTWKVVVHSGKKGSRKGQRGIPTLHVTSSFTELQWPTVRSAGLAPDCE